MNEKRKPRPHETICVRGKTKWRLDAMCLVGMRSRTQTIEMLLDYYLRHHPKVKAAVEDVEDDNPMATRCRLLDEAQQ